MGKKKSRKKQIKFPKLFHAHLTVTGVLFAAYIVLSLLWSPEFLFSDIRGKFQALADEIVNISAHVVGPPQKPEVSANAICSNGNLYITLDWADDSGSDSYDIERDGSPLVIGITSSQHNDSNIAVASTYTYLVTARGAMGSGFAVSDPIEVTTPTECKVVFAPTVQVDSISPDKNVNSIPKITDTRPTFFGSTNIPFAHVSLMLESKTHLYATVEANKNGYWSWRPPVDISEERHILHITAASPEDPTITASNIFEFIVTKEKESGDKKKEKQKIILPISQTYLQTGNDNQQTGEQEKPVIPLSYSLSLGNNEVLQGRNIDTSIIIEEVAEKFVGREAIIRYSIVDKQDKLIREDYASTILEKGKRIDKSLSIAKSVLADKYKLHTEIIFSDYNVSQGINFSVLALPVVKLGGGFVISYQDLLSDMGTISIWLLIALLIWLGILSREYWLSAHALRHITEKSLESWGMVPMRKKKR